MYIKSREKRNKTSGIGRRDIALQLKLKNKLKLGKIHGQLVYIVDGTLWYQPNFFIFIKWPIVNGISQNWKYLITNKIKNNSITHYKWDRGNKCLLILIILYIYTVCKSGVFHLFTTIPFCCQNASWVNYLVSNTVYSPLVIVCTFILI